MPDIKDFEGLGGFYCEGTDKVLTNFIDFDGPSGLDSEMKDDVLNVTLYGIIANELGSGEKDLAKALKGKSGNDVLMKINSVGGNLHSGITMMNILQDHDSNVTAIVQGTAASAAAIVLQGADNRLMATGSSVLIHEARVIAGGTAKVFRNLAERLDKANDALASLFAERTGKKTNVVRELLTEDTEFSAQEAIDNGFANGKYNKKKKQSNTRNEDDAELQNTDDALTSHRAQVMIEMARRTMRVQ